METLGFILSLLLSGLVIGALARLLVPGPDPMGLAATILLGIAGAFVGGLLGRLIFGSDYVVGLLMSIAGAVLILLLVRSTRRRAYS